MSRTLSTLAQIRGRNPRLSLAILNVACSNTVKPAGREVNGDELFDESRVLAEASRLVQIEPTREMRAPLSHLDRVIEAASRIR